MNLKFHTETGSTYEVDSGTKRIRRYNEIYDPANRFSIGWKSYNDLYLKKGERCCIFWNTDDTLPLSKNNNDVVIPCTTTSLVVDIILEG